LGEEDVMYREGRKMAKDVICNGCGRKLNSSSDSGILLEDAFVGEKTWGYFSKKDMVRHRFVICEECYDDMVSRFAIPPDEEEVTEL